MRFVENLANIAFLAATYWQYHGASGQTTARDPNGPARGMCSNPPAVVFRNQYCVECSSTPWQGIRDSSGLFDIPLPGRRKRQADEPVTPASRRRPTTKRRITRRPTTTPLSASSGRAAGGKPRLVEMQSARKNGEVRQLQLFPVGTKLYYQAKIGFDLEGPMIIECMPNLEWSEPPTCFRSCRKLPAVQNGQCGTADFTFVKVNQRVDCRCDSGFSMDGPERITCRLDGNFTRAPTCSIVSTTEPPKEGCRLPPIRNGVCRDLNNQAYLGLPLGIKETFACSCNEGFELVPFGSSTSRRGNNLGDRNSRSGRSGQAVTPVLGSNRQVTIPRDFPVGDCQPICDGDGEYSCLPTCRRVATTTTPAPTCPYPPSINNSGCVNCENHERIDFFNYGDHFTYRCDPGFALVGNPKITCQRNGQWSRGPRCDPVATTTLGPYCGPVPTFPNGNCLTENDDSDVDVHFAGKEATCKCNKFFVLEGSDTITCLRKAGGLLAWSEIPVCSPVTTTARPICSLESIQDQVPNSFCRGVGAAGTTITVFKTGQKAVCECLDAFEERTPGQEATCQGGNQWTNVPGCRPITTTLAPQRCTPPAYQNGYCSNDNDVEFSYALGERIKCTCNTGYRLTTESTMALITCGQKASNLRDPEGSWSVIPSCTLASVNQTVAPPACNPLGTVGGLSCSTTGTRPVTSGADVGDQWTCSCPPSATLTGSRTVICQSRGRGWSGTTPKCSPVVGGNTAPPTTRPTSTTKKPIG